MLKIAHFGVLDHTQGQQRTQAPSPPPPSSETCSIFRDFQELFWKPLVIKGYVTCGPVSWRKKGSLQASTIWQWSGYSVIWKCKCKCNNTTETLFERSSLFPPPAPPPKKKKILEILTNRIEGIGFLQWLSVIYSYTFPHRGGRWIPYPLLSVTQRS